MRKWALSAAVAGCAGALALSTVHAQGGKTAPFSTADYIEIQQLVSRYAYAVDTGADGGKAYANLFAPGAIFGALPGTTGADNLAATARRFQRGPQAVFHYLMDHAIKPQPDGTVIGKEYLAQFVIGDNGEPSRVFGGGHYDDAYERTADGWQFKRRQFIASQSGTEVTIQSPPLQSPHKIAGPSKAGTLTASDYVEIQQLVSHYPFGLDTGAGQGDLWAAVFTADGVFGGGPQKTEGREKLKDFAYGHRPGQGPLYARNFSPNVVITPSPEGATGKMYAAVFDIGVGNGKPSTVLNGGHYEDVYVRTPDGWRIKSRQFLPSKSGTEAAAIAPLKVPAKVGKDPAAQQKASRGKGPSLANEDMVEIQQIIGSYSLALDTGANNGEVYADLFTPDGTLVAGDQTHEGRQNLKAYATQNRPGQGPLFVSHFSANPVIEASAEGATAKAYYVILNLGEGGKPSSVGGGGHYEDRFVKTAQGWRIKRREVIPSKTQLPQREARPTR